MLSALPIQKVVCVMRGCLCKSVPVNLLSAINYRYSLFKNYHNSLRMSSHLDRIRRMW